MNNILLAGANGMIGFFYIILKMGSKKIF